MTNVVAYAQPAKDEWDEKAAELIGPKGALKPWIQAWGLKGRLAIELRAAYRRGREENQAEMRDAIVTIKRAAGIE